MPPVPVGHPQSLAAVPPDPFAMPPVPVGHPQSLAAVPPDLLGAYLRHPGQIQAGGDPRGPGRRDTQGAG
jgi:hypothetical protein